MFKQIIRKLIPLRRRNQLRLMVGAYPFGLRAHFPDLELVGLRPGAVVIDAGANIGQFAESALAYQPLAELHAFEPIDETFATLKVRLHDLGNIHFNNAALGSSTEVRSLIVRNFDECTSFLEFGKKLNDGVYGLNLAAVKTIDAPILRLSDYVVEKRIPRIDLLKLDVQGFELEVLRGAEDILPLIDWIYTEAQFQELYKGGPDFEETFTYLHARGFELVRMTSFRCDDDGALLECDMMFRRIK